MERARQLYSKLKAECERPRSRLAWAALLLSLAGIVGFYSIAVILAQRTGRVEPKAFESYLIPYMGFLTVAIVLSVILSALALRQKTFNRLFSALPIFLNFVLMPHFTLISLFNAVSAIVQTLLLLILMAKGN